MKRTNTGEKYVSRIPQGFYLVRVPGPDRPFAHFRELKDAVAWRDAMLGGQVIARMEEWVRELVEPTDAPRIRILQSRLTRNAHTRANGLRRWGDACVMCGYDTYVEVAHLVAVKDGGSDHSDNLRPLCPNHHKEYDLGLIAIGG
jgi:predicted restriction endonuclease